MNASEWTAQRHTGSGELILRAVCSCGKPAGFVERRAQQLVWVGVVRFVDTFADGDSIQRKDNLVPNLMGAAAPGVDQVFATCRRGHKLVADLGMLHADVLAGRSVAVLERLYATREA